MRESARIVVVGVGNPDRGDDGAGRAVVARLQDAARPGVEVHSLEGDAAAILSAISGRAAAILVDASVSGERHGTVTRIDLACSPLPQGRSGHSTHGFGLAEALALAAALGELPDRCIVYAIAAESFGHGEGLSGPVAASIAVAVDCIGRDIEALLEDARAAGQRLPCSDSLTASSGP